MSEELAGPGAGQSVKDPVAREERLAVHGVRGGAWGGVWEGPSLRPTAHRAARQASDCTQQARGRTAGLGGDQGLQPQRAAAARALSLPVGR